MATYYVLNSTNAAQEVWKLQSAEWHSFPVHYGGENESSCSETSKFAEADSDKGSWYSWMGHNLSKVRTRAVLSVEFPAMEEIFCICAIQLTSSWPHVAVAYMTWGQCDWGTEFFNVFNFNQFKSLLVASGYHIVWHMPKGLEKDQP